MAPRRAGGEKGGEAGGRQEGKGPGQGVGTQGAQVGDRCGRRGGTRGRAKVPEHKAHKRATAARGEVAQATAGPPVKPLACLPANQQVGRMARPMRSRKQSCKASQRSLVPYINNAS